MKVPSQVLKLMSIDKTLCYLSYLASIDSITPSDATARKVSWLKELLAITIERVVIATETLEFYGVSQPLNHQFVQLQSFNGEAVDKKTKVTAAMNHLRTELAHFMPNLDKCFSFRNVCGLRL